MKQLTFEVADDEPVLILEQVWTADWRLLYSKDYQADPPTERAFQYNDAGDLVLEIETSEGMEVHRGTFAYNEKGDVTEAAQYVSGELYERIVTAYRDDGFTQTTWRDNVEAQRLELYETNNLTLKRFYDEGAVTEYHSTEYFPKERRELTRYFDAKNALIAIRTIFFDELEQVVDDQERDPADNLLTQVSFQYSGELVMKETHRRYKNETSEYEIIYEYDDKQNLIKREMRSMSGKVIDFQSWVYDDSCRVVEEKTVGREWAHRIHQYEE